MGNEHVGNGAVFYRQLNVIEIMDKLVHGLCGSVMVDGFHFNRLIAENGARIRPKKYIEPFQYRILVFGGVITEVDYFIGVHRFRIPRMRPARRTDEDHLYISPFSQRSIVYNIPVERRYPPKDIRQDKDDLWLFPGIHDWTKVFIPSSRLIAGCEPVNALSLAISARRCSRSLFLILAGSVSIFRLWPSAFSKAAMTSSTEYSIPRPRLKVSIPFSNLFNNN